MHHNTWLKYSNGISPEGKELEVVCAAHGMKQCVKDPTRGEYLLDLVLSDFSSSIECAVVPGILDKDHRAVIADISLCISSSPASTRKCFNFGKANWKKQKVQNSYCNVCVEEDAGFKLGSFL